MAHGEHSPQQRCGGTRLAPLARATAKRTARVTPPTPPERPRERRLSPAGNTTSQWRPAERSRSNRTSSHRSAACGLCVVYFPKEDCENSAGSTRALGQTRKGQRMVEVID